MKKIKIQAEPWFTNAPFNDLKMVAIKHLGAPAATMEDSHKPEVFKRALARQLFNRSFEYGVEFEIIAPSNPFGKVPKRRGRSDQAKGLTGEYRFVKSGLRAPENDIRQSMMKLIGEHTLFEKAIFEWERSSGTSSKEMFKSTGDKTQFNFIDMLKWALGRGWIINV